MQQIVRKRWDVRRDQCGDEVINVGKVWHGIVRDRANSMLDAAATIDAIRTALHAVALYASADRIADAKLMLHRAKRLRRRERRRAPRQVLATQAIDLDAGIADPRRSSSTNASQVAVLGCCEYVKAVSCSCMTLARRLVAASVRLARVLFSPLFALAAMIHRADCVPIVPSPRSDPSPGQSMAPSIRGGAFVPSGGTLLFCVAVLFCGTLLLLLLSPYKRCSLQPTY